MSELKRNSDFRFTAKAQMPRASTTDIEQSQPRQTLEIERVRLLWESGCDMGGGDPYNTIGTRSFRPRAA